MRLLRRSINLIRLLTSARENRLDLLRWLIRRPALLLGTGAAEVAEVLSNRLESRLKLLAQIQVAAIVGCEYCLDIGAALRPHEGLTERQLLELHDFERSDAFDDTERLVLRLATHLSETPARVPDELRAELDQRFTKAQLVELVAAIAHEHERTRLYTGLGVRPARFAPDSACRVPTRTASTSEGGVAHSPNPVP